jgi:hypothetical protein
MNPINQISQVDWLDVCRYENPLAALISHHQIKKNLCQPLHINQVNPVIAFGEA